MKKWLAGLVLLLAAVLTCTGVLAEEAEDITERCKIKVSSSRTKSTYLTDGTYTRSWECQMSRNPYVMFTAPKGETIGSLYICFAKMPDSWEVQVSDDGKNWTKALDGDTRFLHAFAELPEPSRYVRLLVTMEKKYALRINEMFAFTPGETPDWVQRWEPSYEKADILFVSTHPDDELLFFGGGIPTYANREDCRVMVAYFTHAGTVRSSELLNGLWHTGVRHYPDIGTFQDGKSKNLKEAYKKVGGDEAVNEWMVGLYRRYQPEVVVTQDVDGEYGHTQHRIVVGAVQASIPLAADPAQYPASAAEYGTWQVKKVYLHLWKDGEIMFDWSNPIEKMGGKTSGQLAREAYIDFHNTQPDSLISYGEEYDNRLFGLYHTTVGPDVEKNDFLENIPLN